MPAFEKVTSIERIKIWGWFCNLLIRDLLLPSCLCSSQLFRALFVFQKYNSMLTVAEKACFLPGLEQKKNESLGTVLLVCWFEHQGRKIFRSKDFITCLLVAMFVFSSLCSHFFFSEEIYSFTGYLALLVLRMHFLLEVPYCRQKISRSNSWLPLNAQ